MKTILSIVFVLITLVSFSQDTITNDTLIKPNVNKNIVIGANLTDAEKFKYSGLELMAYSKEFYSGLRLSVAGTAMLSVGVYNIINSVNEVPTYLMNPDGTQQYMGTTTEISSGKRALGYGMAIVGGILTAVGTHHILESSLHIKNAGLILSGDGIGIVIKM